jgi:hypothetical protein
VNRLMYRLILSQRPGQNKRWGVPRTTASRCHASQNAAEMKRGVSARPGAIAVLSPPGLLGSCHWRTRNSSWVGPWRARCHAALRPPPSADTHMRASSNRCRAAG